MSTSNSSYGGSVKPRGLLRYTKWDRDTILAKYRKLQDLHKTMAAELKASRQALGRLQGIPHIATGIGYPPDMEDKRTHVPYCPGCVVQQYLEVVQNHA